MKRTTVTTEDNIGVTDQSNLTPFRIRKKAIHEELFDKYEINSADISKQQKPNQVIPKDWQKEIIVWNVEQMINDNADIAPVDKRFSDKVYVLVFDHPEKTHKFTKKFNMNVFKSINTFIECKGENPSNYNRTIVMETNESDYRLEILAT